MSAVALDGASAVALDAASSSGLVGATATAVGGVIYEVGGLAANRGAVPQVDEPWLKVAAVDFSRARRWRPDNENAGVANCYGHNAFSLGGELLVFGGEATEGPKVVFGSVRRTRPNRGGLKWSTLPDVGRAAPAARVWAASCVVAHADAARDVGLVHGGRDAAGALKADLWVLDAADRALWREVYLPAGPGPGPRVFHTLTAVGDHARHVVVHGGLTPGGGGALVDADAALWTLDISKAFKDGDASAAAAALAALAPVLDAPAKKDVPKDKKNSKADTGKKKVDKVDPKATQKGVVVTDEAPPATNWAKVRLNGPPRSMHVAVGWCDLPPLMQPTPAHSEPGEEAPREIVTWTFIVLGGSGGGVRALSVEADLVESDAATPRYLDAPKWDSASGWAESNGAVESCAAAAVVQYDHGGVYVAGGMQSAAFLSGDATAASSSASSFWVQVAVTEPLPGYVDLHLRDEVEDPPEDNTDLTPAGWGRQETESGDVYEGEFVSGLRSGQGKVTYAKGGGVYEGSWLLDKCHGRGVWEGRNRGDGECRYQGIWRHGLRHGVGDSRFEGPRSVGGDASFHGDYADDARASGEQKYDCGDFYSGPFSKVGRQGGGGNCAYSDGAKYEGGWVDDLRHGHGEQLYADGANYAGAWHGGRRNGFGACTFANRDKYDGKWFADQRCGRGKCAYAGGAAYDGEWAADERSGRGTLEWGESSYSGEWETDRRHGRGAETSNPPRSDDGEISYDGAWRIGVRHGDGSSKYADASTFVGSFKLDSKAQGTERTQTGDVYVGAFHRHRREGRGECAYADGGRYVGAWRSGVRDGVGSYAAPLERYDGDWANDERHGRGLWRGARGLDGEVSYDGEWERDVRSGAAESQYGDGATFAGNYARDIRSYGTLDLASGDVYVGCFNKSGRHGMGECNYADGSTFVGEWSDDCSNTDKGAWTGVALVRKNVETYRAHGDQRFRSLFSSTGGKFAQTKRLAQGKARMYQTVHPGGLE